MSELNFFLQMDQKYDLSIILPVHNEVKAIGSVIRDTYEKIIPHFISRCS